MGWTKRQIVEQAFAEIGLASYEFDIQPDGLQSALRQLDAMLAMWSGTQGIRIGFAGGDGFGDIAADTEVPLWAVEGLYYNLALRLAPSFGKMPNPVTVANAKAGLDAIRVRCVPVTTRRTPGYAGAGNSLYGAVAMPEALEPVATGPDNSLTFATGGN